MWGMFGQEEWVVLIRCGHVGRLQAGGAQVTGVCLWRRMLGEVVGAARLEVLGASPWRPTCLMGFLAVEPAASASCWHCMQEASPGDYCDLLRARCIF